MTTAVLLAFSGGGKEFVREAHVHGFRDGSLLIASGGPGGGLDPEIVRSVPVTELIFAETCEQYDATEDEAGHSTWSTSW